jgi:hypothetical protein
MSDRVFISYASEDEKLARRVERVLSDIGVETFLDRNDIDWGDEFTKRIDDALKWCSALVVIITPASLKSQWVPYEIGIAKSQGKRILPFVAHPSIELPEYIRRYQHTTRLRDMKTYFKSRRQSSLPSQATTLREDARPHVGPIAENATVTIRVEPFFMLAQLFVAYTSSGVAFGYELFSQQARELSLEIERDSLKTGSHGIESIPVLKQRIRNEHGPLACSLFELGYLVSLLPFAFESTEEFHNLSAIIQGFALKELPKGSVEVVLAFTAQLPCPMEEFVEKVERLKVDLQQVVAGQAEKGER